MVNVKSKKKILIGVAWPYANGLQHIGHIAGAYLPPDIFARYNRMLGNEVLMVSGSDTHGTPVTVKADEEGVTPFEVSQRYHLKFIESYLELGLTFDLFTHTHTDNHKEVVHRLFKTHFEKGYIYIDSSKQLFDTKANKFLPDRYVEGTCPFCGASGARGDQCDNCGKTYDAIELKNPISKITGSTDLEVRETKHFYLDLAKLNDPLCKWMDEGNKEHWRANVLNFTKSELEKHNLRGRAITRDMEWGITIPLEGYEDKRIYVWYEAVIGYLSASIEWAKIHNNPELWKSWWETPSKENVESYYFIGKDNIVFHSIIWPAMLIAYGGLNLPYNVPANEYLNSAGRKFSKSRGKSIYVLDVLKDYQSDAWRYALNAMAPETADVDFTWEDFVERVNNELLANWGNLVNRLLGFTYKRFDQKVPMPGELDQVDKTLLEEVKAGFNTVGSLLSATKFRSASDEIRRLCQKVNQYLNDKAPWTLIKTDEKAAATSVYVGLQCITWLKTMWAPIIPKSSQQIHETLGFTGSLFGEQYTKTVSDSEKDYEVLCYDHKDSIGKWEATDLPIGQQLQEPKAPFIKLDPAVVIPQEE